MGSDSIDFAGGGGKSKRFCSIESAPIDPGLIEAKRHIVRAFVKRTLLVSIAGKMMLLAHHRGGIAAILCGFDASLGKVLCKQI
jgi:hypothetical protein